jgi:hypothetical protein
MSDATETTQVPERPEDQDPLSALVLAVAAYLGLGPILSVPALIMARREQRRIRALGQEPNALLEVARWVATVNAVVYSVIFVLVFIALLRGGKPMEWLYQPLY